MSIVTEKKTSRQEKTRFISVVEPFKDGSAVVRITEVFTGPRSQREVVDEYFVDHVQAEDSEVFVWSKRVYDPNKPDAIYHVWVQDDQNMGCECKGWEYGGKCRHVAGTLKLRQTGKV